jgi:hypothetical protein
LPYNNINLNKIIYSKILLLKKRNDYNRNVWGGVTQSVSLIYNVKNALAHQNNAIEASAIGRIIGRNREKARVFWRKLVI